MRIAGKIADMDNYTAEQIDNRCMTALEFINIIQPEHGRTSCSDENIGNGFYTRNGAPDWYGRCTRCMYLEIIRGDGIPEGFDPEYCSG